MQETISVNVDSTEGLEVYSVNYQISNDLKRTILECLSIIRKTPLIKSCSIDGGELWKTVEQFDSTIDEEERQIVEPFDKMISDIQYIIIKPSGNISFTAHNKYDADYTIKFEIE